MLLDFPLAEPDRFDEVIGVDHDPVVQEGVLGSAVCTDYLGRSFPHCYDEHSGTDYILVGGFDAMRAGSTAIVAAAPGVVVYAEDGHYDECHATISGAVDCDGHDGIANAVILEHEGGWRTLYWHMKTDSVAVALDDEVQTGDVLGLVGSSGNSSLPHLHFGLEDPTELRLDPYAGPFSQWTSFWCDQGPSTGLPGGC